MGKARHSMTALLLALALLFCSLAAQPAAAAGSAAMTVQAKVDSATGQVAVSGTISSGAGIAVTVRVTNPKGVTDFMDQGLSGEGGRYTFTYMLDKSLEGVYQVRAGGTGIGSPAVTEFTYSLKTGGGGGNGGDLAVNPKGRTQLSNNGTIVGKPYYDHAAGQAILALPAEQLRKSEEMTPYNESGVNNIPIQIDEVKGAQSYAVEWPMTALAREESNVFYKLETAVGSVTLPGHMLKPEAMAESSTITLVIAFADAKVLDEATRKAVGKRPVIQIYLLINGDRVPWSNPEAPVRIAIPYEPTKDEAGKEEHLVVWHLDDAGHLSTVVNGRYDADAGQMAFTTTHFSHYAVAYVKRTFEDITHVPWARKEIEALASRGVIQGTSDTSFLPDHTISRADYMLMLVRSLEFVAEGSEAERFSDVVPGAYYADALGVARELGIAQGYGDNRFRPDETISRQEMMTLTARALEKFGRLTVSSSAAVLDSFADREAIADYAVRYMAALVDNGLIVGSGGRVNPEGSATRAEAAVFLYRIYTK